MAKVSINVEINSESILGKIAELNEHIEAINNILHSLRFDKESVTAKEIASSAGTNEASEVAE